MSLTNAGIAYGNAVSMAKQEGKKGKTGKKDPQSSCTAADQLQQEATLTGLALPCLRCEEQQPSCLACIFLLYS